MAYAYDGIRVLLLLLPPKSPLYLPYISPKSLPYLPHISSQTQRAHAVLTAWAEAMASEANFNAPDDQVLDKLLTSDPNPNPNPKPNPNPNPNHN